MPHITATATGQPQITATVGETKIDVAVSGGVGPSGVIAVSAPLVNSGAPSAASLSISVGDGLAVVDGELVADYTGPSFTAAVVSAAPPTIDASLLTQGTLSASRLPASGVAAGQYTSVTVDSYGRVTAGGNHSVAWSDLTGKPTTVAAAGLADAVVTGDSRLADAREWSASTVSQADAEAGISTSRFAFTPLRVFQAVAAWWAGSSAKTKLDGIATGATANATDAQLRDRSTHTGSQLAATISDFASAVVAAAPPTTNASLLTSGTLPDARLSSNIARTSDVSSAVAAVVNAAPAALDTLNELAAALGNDASFATTVTNALAAKAPLASPTFTGTVSGITATMVGLGNVPNVDATARANHTGTQTASTISDFASAAVSAVTWTTLTGKPTFATVATSGAYSDLTGTPAAYSLPTASGSVLGGVKIGSGLSIDGSGVLTATYSYSLPVATASVLGGVKQGSNVTIGVDGTISVAAPVTSLPYSSITGTPTLATVATSGSAADLTGTLSASRLPSTSVTPGSYGSASSVATYTVDATGRLTAAGSTSIAIAAGAVSGLAAIATSGSASDLGSGTVATARLGSGTANSTTFLRGDGAWSAPTASVAYATTAQAQDLTATTVAMHPANVRTAITNWLRVKYRVTYTINGASAVDQSPQYGQLVTSASVSNSACSLYADQFGWQSPRFSGLTDWSKPITLYGRITRQTASATTVFRYLYGQLAASGFAFETLSNRGIGIEIRQTRIWLVCHNGSSLTQADTGIDAAASDFSGQALEIVLRSDGAGNVTLTASLAGGAASTFSTTGGPTVAGSNSSIAYAALSNGSGTSGAQFNFTPHHISAL